MVDTETPGTSLHNDLWLLVVRPAPIGACRKFKTLCGRGGDEILSHLLLAYGGHDGYDVDLVRGGPNGTLSLREAQNNYVLFQGCDRRWSRKPGLPLAKHSGTNVPA